MKNEREKLREYFLGKLAREEGEELADRYFTDEALFERLKEAETELLDQYVRGYLTREDRTCFETYLARHPDGKAKVALATALMRAAQTEPEPEATAPETFWRPLVPRIHWASATCLLIAVIAIFYAMYSHRRYDNAHQEIVALRHQITEMEKEITEKDSQIAALQNRPQPAPSQDKQSPRQGTQTSIAYLVFPPSVRGTAPSRSLKLRPATSQVSVTILIDPSESYTSYRAEITSADGSQKLGERVLQPSTGQRALRFTLTPSDLTRSAYVIRLTGVGQPEQEARLLRFSVDRET